MPWICFNDAFLSIVAHPTDPDRLLVRARREGDIERVFPMVEARRTPGRDYLFRAEVNRLDVADVIAQRLFETAETNFKDSVKDQKLHDAYAAFWNIHGRLQPGGPYGGWRERRRQPYLPRLTGRADPGYDDPLGDPLFGFEPTGR
jgi:hypothetical protein